ncbi:hypothetical protein STEG23_002683, partial [Scotinomys teguina]
TRSIFAPPITPHDPWKMEVDDEDGLGPYLELGDRDVVKPVFILEDEGCNQVLKLLD